MKEILRATSTNGRWGLVIVSDFEGDINVPVKGSLSKLGVIGGMTTYKFTENQNADTFIMACGDADMIAGAVVIEKIDLQSSDTIMLIAGGNFFSIKTYGYKRRSSRIESFSNGNKIDVPATVLAAMGVIRVDEEPVKIEIPALDSPLAAALAKAGIK